MPISAPADPAAMAPRRFASLRTVFAMMLREMVTTYGRSPGGYLWAVIEPVAAIGLLSLAFSVAFHAPSLGICFPLFFATAYLPYMLFHDISNKLATALRFSGPLLSYPAVTHIDVLAARLLLNLLTHLLVFALVLPAILLAFDHRAILDPPGVLNALAMASALALGVGTLNCHLMLAIPTYERVWVIATRPLFIVSGVFLLFEDLPQAFQGILWFNPLYHVTGAMRAAVYPAYDATYVSPAFVYALAAVSLTLGLLALRHGARELLA